MKNALLLLGIWVGIYLFAYSVVELQGVDATHVELPTATEMLDEVHGFALPLPLGWSALTVGDVLRLTAPIAGIEVWAASVAGATVDEALAQAWEAVDACSSCPRPEAARSDSLSWGREGAMVEFAPDREGRTGGAVVLLWEGRARVLVMRLEPELSMPARVASDLETIRSGFRVVESEPALPAVQAL